MLIDIVEDTSLIVMSGRLENGSFKILDTVVSMNGFHAFPDKQIAFHEIWCVLKAGGDFNSSSEAVALISEDMTLSR